jgi:hypothetical protein
MPPSGSAVAVVAAELSVDTAAFWFCDWSPIVSAERVRAGMIRALATSAVQARAPLLMMEDTFKSGLLSEV